MPLKIALIASEIFPFSKAGGLGDVMNALPKHLRLLGHEPIVVTPYYGFINQQAVPQTEVGKTEVEFNGRRYPVYFTRAVLPGHTPVDVIFVHQPDLFGNRDRVYGYSDDAIRFAIFSRSVFDLFHLLGYVPDILHCHDMQTGLIPNYLRTTFGRDPWWKKTAIVYTIHNILYQLPRPMWYDIPLKERDRGLGHPPEDDDRLKRVNFTLRGIRYADIISTVSERYAQEILTKKYGEGLDPVLRRRRDRVFGIINGIDYTVFNPSFDPYVPIHYDWNSLDKKRANKIAYQKEFGLTVDSDTPLLGIAHRFTEQKGFNLITEILPVLMQERVQLGITGFGDRGYVRLFRQAIKKYPRQVAANLSYDVPMASRIYAASDMFLMPSRFEPCGVSQLISLRYGSVPIVHRTGGLADTITDFDARSGNGNGFIFENYTGPDLLVALTRAIETFKYPKVWEHLTWQAMRQSFSWELPAQKYVELYRQAQKIHALV
jgi:starch synthase